MAKDNTIEVTVAAVQQWNDTNEHKVHISEAGEINGKEFARYKIEKPDGTELGEALAWIYSDTTVEDIIELLKERLVALLSLFRA